MTQSRNSLIVGIATIALIACLAAAGGLWLRYGGYGYGVLTRRGGSYWRSMRVDDPHLSPAIRVALQNPQPPAIAGQLMWTTREPGFQTAELPVFVGGAKIDEILLTRIDPARFRFTVRNAPNGDQGIDQWEKRLPSSLLIVNGSYFGLKGYPDTPVRMNGVSAGPSKYAATAGAFVSRDGAAEIDDLHDIDWKIVLAHSSNAMVSYPLLIGEDGRTHVKSKSRWLANRTFIGEDVSGLIVVGTTREAFFTLDGLAQFLKASPLKLKTALNLDGGPIACQSVRVGAYHRKFYARWEVQVSGDQVRLLSWPFTKATWAMPMVLTVERRPS